MLSFYSHAPWKRSHRRVFFSWPLSAEVDAQRVARGIARYMGQHEAWEIYLDERKAPGGEAALEGERWDGVLSLHTPTLLADACGRLGIPLVDINSENPPAGIPSVTLDQVAVGRAGAEHLLDRGVIHFAYAGFTNRAFSRARRKGFLQTLQLRGRHCRLVEAIFPEVVTPEWNRREIDALSQWMRTMPKPLGLMACDDARAVQLVHAADAAGLAVPEDVAILGANDDEARCELTKPPISSVPTNENDWGFKAAELLHRLMGGASVAPQSLIPPLPVVTRGSTDVLAINDKKIAAAVRFIQEHGCEPITVADVCRHAGIARTQLEQKFRTYFARSPQAEVRRVRLLRIRQLLHETDLPLKTIAELTGFQHVEYLSVFCKKALGESPGRYRRRVRAGAPPAAENVLPNSLL